MKQSRRFICSVYKTPGNRLFALWPPDTTHQPRLRCSRMDAWALTSEPLRTEDQLSSARRSTPPVDVRERPHSLYPLLILLRNKINPPPPQHTHSLPHTHPHLPLPLPLDWGGGGQAGCEDQLVISSDKETCWMCSCIKKKVRTRTRLFLRGSSGSLTFQALSHNPTGMGGGGLSTKVFKNTSTSVFLTDEVLYSQDGGSCDCEEILQSDLMH